MKIYMITYLCTILVSLLFFILSLILMILFVGNLRKIMMQRMMIEKQIINSRSTTKSMDYTNDNDNNLQQNDGSNIKHLINNEFLYVVVKHALLIPIAICSTFILFLLSTIIIILIGITTWSPFPVICTSLDCMISPLCIYLLLAVNKRHYNLLCSKIHRLCEKCELLRIKKRFENQLNAAQTTECVSIEITNQSHNKS